MTSKTSLSHHSTLFSRTSYRIQMHLGELGVLAVRLVIVLPRGERRGRPLSRIRSSGGWRARPSHKQTLRWLLHPSKPHENSPRKGNLQPEGALTPTRP